MIVPLWNDWVLMNRLHCTQPELEGMDAANVEIFLAFLIGESEGIEQQRQERAAEANLKKGRG